MSNPNTTNHPAAHHVAGALSILQDLYDRCAIDSLPESTNQALWEVEKLLEQAQLALQTSEAC